MVLNLPIDHLHSNRIFLQIKKLPTLSANVDISANVHLFFGNGDPPANAPRGICPSKLLLPPLRSLEMARETVS